ncbi:MAG: hypothetical protein FWG50_07760 [Kiritimatiellaeota bacterium]|nr:hypothetical protein [Kiritimatiellota bacterium]
MILFPHSFESSCRRLAISGQHADDASPGAQGFRPALTAAYSRALLNRRASCMDTGAALDARLYHGTPAFAFAPAFELYAYNDRSEVGDPANASVLGGAISAPAKALPKPVVLAF